MLKISARFSRTAAHAVFATMFTTTFTTTSIAIAFTPSAVASDVAAPDITQPASAIIYYDLPVLPLGQALLEFSLQSGLSVVVQQGKVAGFNSSPIIGGYPVEKALRHLLAHAPLDFSYQADAKRIVIHDRPTPISDPQNTPKPQQPLDALLEEVIVTGINLPLRYNTVTSSQVHNGLSVYDTARFLSVLPQALIEDQAPTDIMELLRNSSSITPADGLADTNDDFYIRGFPRNALYWQGFRLDEQLGTKILPAVVEQAEILKGPSTLRYGQAEPGGIVNLVGKSPLDEQHLKLGLRTGTGGYQNQEADITGAFDKNSVLTYRLIAAHESFDELKDQSDGEKTAYYPALRFKPNNKTHFELAYLQQESTYQRDQGSIIFSPIGDAVDVFALAQTARQAKPNFDAKLSLWNGDFHYAFNNSWQIRGQVSALSETQSGVRGDSDIFITTSPLVRPDEVNPGVLIVAGEIPLQTTPSDPLATIAKIQSIYDESANVDSEAFSLNLQGSPTILGLANHVLLGVDSHSQTVDESITLEQREDIERIALGNNNTPEAVTTERLVLGSLITRHQNLKYHDYGIYLQDSIELSTRWVASIGGRHMVSKAELQTPQNNSPTELPSFKETTAQLGLVFKGGDNYSLYSSYAQGVKPNYIIDDIGSVIDEPEKSDQYELGVKVFSLANGLSGTSSIYRINKENIVDIQIWDGVRRAIVQAEQAVQGWDLDLTYQPKENINIIAALSFLNAEITQGNNNGNVPAHVADTMFNVFMNYKPAGFHTQMPLSFTLNMLYVSDRFGDDANQQLLEAFNVVDLGASYEWQIGESQLRVRADMKNVFDTDYYESSAGHLRSNTGMGRTFIAGLSLSF